MWTVQRTTSSRFPFRIALEQGDRVVLAVRARAAWPGPGQNIFCLREREQDPAEHLELVEHVPIAVLTTVGRKVTVVLDRPQRKRCEFLAVDKPRADGHGTYEQVFFRTESGIRAHRSRSRVELRATPGTLRIVIDSAERYAWSFPDATVTPRKLPVGDYALLDGERIAAVVERKSFDNLLGDIGSVQAMHQQLADLAAYDASAMVVEAEYRDFLDASRLKGRWPAAHVARVLAELAALHPRLPIVYAGNRKMASVWTHQFFLALASRAASRAPQLVMEIAPQYNAAPRTAGLDERIREQALHGLPQPFLAAELVAHVPGADIARVRRVIAQLKAEGLLERVGRGRGARWQRVPLG